MSDINNIIQGEIDSADVQFYEGHTGFPQCSFSGHGTNTVAYRRSF